LRKRAAASRYDEYGSVILWDVTAFRQSVLLPISASNGHKFLPDYTVSHARRLLLREAIIDMKARANALQQVILKENGARYACAAQRQSGENVRGLTFLQPRLLGLAELVEDIPCKEQRSDGLTI
jgi:hypothetical protein